MAKSHAVFQGLLHDDENYLRLVLTKLKRMFVAFRASDDGAGACKIVKTCRDDVMFNTVFVRDVMECLEKVNFEKVPPEALSQSKHVQSCVGAKIVCVLSIVKSSVAWASHICLPTLLSLSCSFAMVVDRSWPTSVTFTAACPKQSLSKMFTKECVGMSPGTTKIRWFAASRGTASPWHLT